MRKPMPSLNVLRAFEAAARHLSMTKAAQELHVTPAALSHQIRGLELSLGAKMFERGCRSITLTAAGQQLYPGLRDGFARIRDAVSSLAETGGERVLAVSTLPGFTAKWLAPRLQRFCSAHPSIGVRITSSVINADFEHDGIDCALRNLPVDAPADPGLIIEPLAELRMIPVCSPKLIDAYRPLAAGHLEGVPLIHDDSQVSRTGFPSWSDWFTAAGITGIKVGYGLRFSNADHAIDACLEGAGLLLASDILAYDALLAGRLVMPFPLSLRSGRAYCLVFRKTQQRRAHLQAFREWLRQEVAALVPAGAGATRVSGGAAAAEWGHAIERGLGHFW